MSFLGNGTPQRIRLRVHKRKPGAMYVSISYIKVNGGSTLSLRTSYYVYAQRFYLNRFILMNAYKL